MIRIGSSNPNWKGGLCSLKKADEVLALSDDTISEIVNRIVDNCTVDSMTQCWNWIGPFFKNGRPRLTFGGNNHLAYRIAFVVFKGSTQNLCVLHTCDNPPCLNPEHLWLGTNADNSADMVAKGRSATGDRNGSRLYPERLARGDANIARQRPETRQGARNGRALLTEDQVREIRAKYRPYINNHKPSNQRQLAEEYGVAVWVIRLIASGKTWRSVK